MTSTAGPARRLSSTVPCARTSRISAPRVRDRCFQASRNADVSIIVPGVPSGQVAVMACPWPILSSHRAPRMSVKSIRRPTRSIRFPPGPPAQGRQLMTIGLRSALSAGKRMISKEKPLSDVRSTPIRMATDGAAEFADPAAIPIAVHSALLSQPTIQFANWRSSACAGLAESMASQTVRPRASPGTGCRATMRRLPCRSGRCG